MGELNYIYKETESKNEIPEGDNWEFWGMRISPEEEKAVWRKIEDDKE